MTTAAEVRQLLGRYPAEAQRVLFKPSSLLGSDDGLDDLAREVVALANREGGRLVLGVSESGQFEGRLSLSREEIETAVETLLSTRTVPRPGCTVEHLTGEDGDLAVLRVEPRRGAPHAFARVTAQGSVGGRAYFVRDGARTRTVTEAQLAWMFRVAGDPALRRKLALDLHTVAGELRVAESVPQPRAAGHFATLLERVPDQVGRAVAGDAEARGAALTELAGWAFLLELEELLERSDVDVDEVPLDELPVPASGSAFGHQGPGLRELLDGDRRRGGLAGLLGRKGPGRLFRLPRGAELQVDYLSRQNKGRVTLVHPRLVLTFSALAAESGRGLSWAEDSGHGDLEWTRLQVVLTCSLPFPAQGPADVRYESLAQRLEARLRGGWDTAGFLDAFDRRYLDRIVRP